MPREPWARLAAPFSHDALAWRVAEVDEGGALARMVPMVSAVAVAARLDEVVGPAGWSFQLAALGADALVGNLTVDGVTRAAVVRVRHGPEVDPGRFADEALSEAALRLGMRPPVAQDAAYWVEYDVDAGEPLHLPELEGAAVAGPVAPRAPEPDAAEDGSGVAAMAGAPAVDGAAAAQDSARGQGAHQVIERLIDRLKDEGLGKEAALLVVRYQGYGSTPEASRELYGKLRALLLEKGAAVS